MFLLNSEFATFKLFFKNISFRLNKIFSDRNFFNGRTNQANYAGSQAKQKISILPVIQKKLTPTNLCIIYKAAIQPNWNFSKRFPKTENIFFFLTRDCV